MHFLYFDWLGEGGGAFNGMVLGSKTLFDNPYIDKYSTVT